MNNENLTDGIDERQGFVLLMRYTLIQALTNSPQLPRACLLTYLVYPKTLIYAAIKYLFNRAKLN